MSDRRREIPSTAPSGLLGMVLRASPVSIVLSHRMILEDASWPALDVVRTMGVRDIRMMYRRVYVTNSAALPI